MRSAAKSNAWYVQFEGSNFGPLSVDEVRVIQASGKLKGQLYVWRDGLADWMPIESLSDFGPGAAAQRARQPSGSERRTRERKGLLAIVRFDSLVHSSVDLRSYTGACHDISIGGMLVLSNHNVGYEGSRLHLAVTPLQGAPISPFDAEAQVTHVMSGEKGFGVRFLKIGRQPLEQIERFQGGGGKVIKFSRGSGR